MQITPSNIESFKLFLAENEKSVSTIRKYSRVVENFMEYLNGDIVTKMSLLEYRTHLLEKMSASTVNGYITALNQYLCFAGQSSLKIKMLRVQRKAFIDANRDLSEREYKRLVNTAQTAGKERLSLVIQAICSTGIRISELEYITVEALEEGCADVSLKGKHRTVLIPKQLRELLLSYVKRKGINTGPVFQTRNGRPLDRSNLAHEMKRLCEEARVDPQKVFPHNLRHLFAKSFYAVEKDLAHLADVLGHSSVETTRIYVATSAQAFARTLNRMNLICNTTE